MSIQSYYKQQFVNLELETGRSRLMNLNFNIDKDKNKFSCIRKELFKVLPTHVVTYWNMSPVITKTTKLNDTLYSFTVLIHKRKRQ